MALLIVLLRYMTEICDAHKNLSLLWETKKMSDMSRGWRLLQCAVTADFAECWIMKSWIPVLWNRSGHCAESWMSIRQKWSQCWRGSWGWPERKHWTLHCGGQPSGTSSVCFSPVGYAREGIRPSVILKGFKYNAELYCYYVLYLLDLHRCTPLVRHNDFFIN